ncbi:MAG: flagellar protein FlaC [Archaeoglobus sp.]|nr:flagellar protein FlaC [Archaeoglobus sp.]
MKKKKREEEKEELEAEEQELEALDGEVVEEEEAEDSETITNIIERLNEIDNRLPRVDVSINNLKRELGDLREELTKLDDSLKDMMALYEIVSAQINPFVGSSKVTSLSIERLDEMEKRIEELEFLIDGISHDLKLIFKKSLNVKDIVNKVLYEEVLS